MNRISFHAPHPQHFVQTGGSDYQLVDSGNGRKLEQFGPYLLDRPEVEAIWQPALPAEAWKKADGFFVSTAEENGGHWKMGREIPEQWGMKLDGLKIWAHRTPSRHVGVFPEQIPQWAWMQDVIKRSKRSVRVLNLFGYTGAASVAAGQVGANVTHVDASKKSVAWAKDNASLNELPGTAIRWIVDDVNKFVNREIRRGSVYDGLIMDPPKFGRGPKGEVWEFYKFIPQLLHSCAALLSPEPLFFLITAYSIKASYLTLYHALQDVLAKKQGSIRAGELVIKEKSGGRDLSTAIYAAWSSIDSAGSDV